LYNQRLLVDIAHNFGDAGPSGTHEYRAKNVEDLVGKVVAATRPELERPHSDQMRHDVLETRKVLWMQLCADQVTQVGRTHHADTAHQTRVDLLGDNAVLQVPEEGLHNRTDCVQVIPLEPIHIKGIFIIETIIRIQI